MPEYYEFEVSLDDLQPRIWRRFLLPDLDAQAHWVRKRLPAIKKKPPPVAAS
ncbi:MAG: hypothetical protein ACK6CU_08675 [Deltaproteobacteria bacterium]|jgi:hypothetical protein